MRGGGEKESIYACHTFKRTSTPRLLPMSPDPQQDPGRDHEAGDRGRREANHAVEAGGGAAGGVRSRTVEHPASIIKSRLTTYWLFSTHHCLREVRCSQLVVVPLF